MAAAILGLGLVVGTDAWALPNHSVHLFSGYGFSPDRFKSFGDRDFKPDPKDGWGKDHEYDDKGQDPKWLLGKDWGDDDKRGWYGKDDKYWKDDKYGKHEKYPKYGDPDCDPPVATPEPATLLLFGGSLGGAVIGRRWRRWRRGG